MKRDEVKFRIGMALSIPELLMTPDQWLEKVLAPAEGQEPFQTPYRREPYRKHMDHVPELETVFRALVGYIPPNGLRALSIVANVPYDTIRTWRRMLSNDSAWRPSHDAYRVAKRIFTDEEEERLVHLIRLNYLDNGLYYSDQDFKQDALQFRQKLVSEMEATGETIDEEHMKRLIQFKCSRPFILEFRKRHLYSLRRPSLKRRPTVNENQIAEFTARVKQLLKKYTADRVINVDETNWRTVAAGFLTWGLKGADSVQCNIDNDDKEGVTVIGAIDAAGKKLPLTVVGKGKTLRCLAGYELGADVWKAYSESGWTTSDVMCGYFHELRRKLFPTGDVLLILDTYAAHRSADVRAVATLYEIELVFIPPGCTDRLQPLDRKVFGALKSFARQQWRRHYHETFGAKVKRSTIAQGLVEAWNRLTPKPIEAAWEIYEKGWNLEEQEVEPSGLEDEEYQQLISIYDLLDM
jgi:hypothetical protein